MANLELEDCNFMADKPHEECGIFGIYDRDGYNAALTTYYALYALQHRGQESCGIAVNDNGTIICHKDMGLVRDVFNDIVLKHLVGKVGVGHVRYSTTGASFRENAQPLVSRYLMGSLTIAHNGNLVNMDEIRGQLEKEGVIFQSCSDTEILANLLSRERVKTDSIEQALSNIMNIVKGSYSLIVMTPSKLIAVRDPNGIRPLSMGKMGNTIVFASETCAFDSIGADFVRDIEPGEIVIVSDEKITARKEHCGEKSNLCIFEYIYFARPDSTIQNLSVYTARKKAGKILARDHAVDADIVIGVPDSGIPAAIGFAEYSGIPYGEGFIKNKYIGRTFIQPTQNQRETGVRIKLNALKASVEGKRVVIVDDSIVRGTTSRRFVQQIRDAGATEIHLRISSPPFRWSCFFGTDIPSRKDLVAAKYDNETIRQMLGADSLGFLSLEHLPEMVEGADCGFCDACFSGDYPIPVPDQESPKNNC